MIIYKANTNPKVQYNSFLKGYYEIHECIFFKKKCSILKKVRIFKRKSGTKDSPQPESSKENLLRCDLEN